MKKIVCGSFNVFLSAMALILCFQSTVFAYETFLCTGGDFEKDIGDFGDECVLYVRDEAKISRTGCSGYAKTCYQSAQSAGYAVGQTPEVGAIMVINGWGTNTAGHVGIVIDKRNDDQEVKLRHSNWCDNNCKTVSEDWINVSQYPVLGYIYCDGEGPSANENETYINLRIVNGIGWYPSNKTCVNASQWYKTVDGKVIASYADNSACYLVGIEYYNSIIWHDVLFGTGDLPEECTQ